MALAARTMVLTTGMRLGAAYAKHVQLQKLSSPKKDEEASWVMATLLRAHSVCLLPQVQFSVWFCWWVLPTDACTSPLGGHSWTASIARKC
ncbi:hypothetical protein BDA96_06G045800 [Sorghum bicolor]|uniref:Uncharacterized protein n=2 Tax=Sorghum bicolor TaxID=4558 RepID=A0A921QRR7_SORBI|nr:hypothetical protein BDA96_06G045800 [Sorghum bicolor]OQU81326.1 hypothetical protein SORBI_3006G041750 [Sorghum bicolor]